jgi:mannitol/fructose-specific phosphotransferase system IIA component (Ntr-type)
MQLENLLTSRHAVNASAANDAAQAFHEISAAFAAASIIPKSAVDAVRDAFVAREKQGSTSLGLGLAVPHVFHDGVEGIHLAVARFDSGIELGAPDGRPVKVMFCLIASEKNRKEYLAALGAVVRVARDKDYRRLIERAGAAAQVIECLMQGDRSIAR